MGRSISLSHNWSNPSVAAFLERVEGKGSIIFQENKPVKRYRSLSQKEEAVQEENRKMIDCVYRGDVVLLAQSLSRPKALNDVEMKELITEKEGTVMMQLLFRSVQGAMFIAALLALRMLFRRV